MSDDRVVSFKPKARPAAGQVTLSTDALFLPFSKTHHGPHWAFTAQAEVDGEDAPVAIHAALTATIPDEPDSMGYLDRGEDGFSGKFVVGHDWEETIRLAAFSTAPWDLQISFAVDADGDLTRVSLAMARRRTEP